MKCKHCENENARYPACNSCGSVLEIKDRLSEIRFSYSSLSSFETCKHGWYLTYIEQKERGQNFYSEYGLLVHETLEKFFRDELEAIELSDYYIGKWDEFIKSPPPYFVKIDEYKEQGFQFFENFSFNKNDYNIILIEGIVNIDEEIKLVVKPDLIIQDKQTGKYILLDYKSSLIYKKGKLDKDKWNGYKKQMSLYSAFCGYPISEVWVWFIRDNENEFEKFNPNEKDLNNIKDWANQSVKLINSEIEFKPTINKFFCDNLCSVSSFCKFKK